MVHGSNAVRWASRQTDVIAEVNRIVGFFGTGRSGIGSDDAKILFFEADSTLVKVEEVTIISCKQAHIKIAGHD
eukprot:2266575-Karenia_brevis.AAC.1